MNNIQWLYIGDVVHNTQTALFVLFIAFFSLLVFILGDQGYNRAALKSVLKTLIVLGFLCMIFPSSNTLHEFIQSKIDAVNNSIIICKP